MDKIINLLLPYVFNSKQGGGSAGTPNKNEYATSYGKFKPVYYCSWLPPRNDVDAQKLYNHIRTTAWYLDAVPFLTQKGLPIRIGVDDIISAIPIWGDLIGVFLAAYQIFLSFLFGVPMPILGRMALNVVIDFAVGIVPVLGDILDALFKSNLRNLALLEDWLLEGKHKYNIEVTPNDEFLPKKGARGSKSGFFGFGASSNSTNGSAAKDKYRTGAASPPAGTRRFNRADLQPEDLD